MFSHTGFHSLALHPASGEESPKLTISQNQPISPLFQLQTPFAKNFHRAACSSAQKWKQHTRNRFSHTGFHSPDLDPAPGEGFPKLPISLNQLIAPLFQVQAPFAKNFHRAACSSAQK